MLQQHLPPLIRRMLPECRQHFNILSVGSGEGDVDMAILNIIKEELQKSDHGRQMNMFNRAVEPNEYMCGLYKGAIEKFSRSLSDDRKTEFEIRQQTFQEYQESQRHPIKFDIVHFIHSIYYVDIEQTLRHCLDKELNDKGHFVSISMAHDLMYQVFMKQRKDFHDKESADDSPEISEKITEVAKKNGWKFQVYTMEYSIDVTEVFDPNSSGGNLLLDFLTLTANFRETADKQQVEETVSDQRPDDY